MDIDASVHSIDDSGTIVHKVINTKYKLYDVGYSKMLWVNQQAIQLNML